MSDLRSAMGTKGRGKRYPTPLAISRDEVHVWQGSLEQPSSVIESLQRYLSDDEHRRAHRFHFDRDRRHFIVGRGLLRILLGQYLGLDPAQVRFQYGPQGKPVVTSAGGKPGHGLRFNLSHSHQLVLYAVTCHREVGIDLEYMRPIADLEQLAAHTFSPRENAMLQAVPEHQRIEAFYNCWTRKEAYIKARGDGLAHPLDQFDVSLVPGEPARLLRVADDAQETDRWGLWALRPAAGYVAALCVEGHDWNLVYQTWESLPIGSGYILTDEAAAVISNQRPVISKNRQMA